MNINALLDYIASDAGRIFKTEALAAHKNNNVLKRVVFLALDPFTQFHIRKIPAYVPAKANQADSLDSVLDSLNALSTRAVTGNAAIEFLAKLLSSLTADDAKVLERVISKDLRCGVSEATANAVWPNLIHEFPCMLASAYDQKLVEKVKFPAYVQLKLDGMRFNAIVRGGVVEFRSRNGKIIDIADPMFALPFIVMAGDQDVVFDGELLVRGSDGQVLDRKTGNGILNKAVKGTQSRAEGEKVCATLWDIIPLTEFEDGVCRTKYESRLSTLRGMIARSRDTARIHLVPSKEVNSLDEARVLFESYLAEGQEGIILKTKDMIWENKRSKNQIKFKGELECDLRVVGWVEGTGKNVGRLGALVLESADGIVQTNVGTGFTDNDRDTLTRENTVGKIVAIKYNARIIDKKTGVASLFLPVFQEVRLDKTEADTSQMIK